MLPYRILLNEQVFVLSFQAVAMQGPGALDIAALETAFPDVRLQERVVVVGAGAAGVTAAYLLTRFGLRTVVLEARHRPGGRVWTVRHGRTQLDLGPCWIHGIEGNPLAALVRRVGARLVQTDRTRIALYSRWRRRRVPAEQLRKLAPFFLQLLLESKDVAFASPHDISLTRALLRTGIRYLFRLPSSLAVIRWAWGAFELVMGTDTGSLSARYWDQDLDLTGGDWFVTSGYWTLFEPLLQELTVHYGMEVTEIRWGEDRPVELITRDGTQYVADRVVVTLPLGVLQQRRVRFVPDLPGWKRRAIGRLGFGCLNKVILLFPRVFWPAETDYVGFLPECPRGYSYFVNLQKLCGVPALMGYVAGRLARRLERASDDETVARALRPLRRTFGAVPEPEQVWLTRWASDPFACGSYSYIPVGAYGGEFDQLRAPVANRLFFAGEATHRVFPGAVHGAVLSGVEAALRIAALARSEATTACRAAAG